MKCLQLNVKGRVQGVGFRFTTKILADELNVKGSVKNEEDGSVTIIACGTDLILDDFIKKIRKSPTRSGKVTHLEITEINLPNPFSDFHVLY